MFLIKLVKLFFYWRADPAPLNGEDVVIAQSFGLRNGGPGLSNEALVKIVKDIRCLKPKTLVIAQWEIGDQLGSFPNLQIIREHRERGKYLDTREVLAQAKEYCKKKNVGKKAIIVAHPEHYLRVQWAAEKMGFKVTPIFTQQVPYDKESIQPWTRSKTRFIAREVPARILYLLKGWI
ncbi:MAG: hypothetical protein PHN74_00465 [Candidatus Pacebacteria bacterium]|nr:hypothetical protein [Candidatus Paceibacterota bacterium]